MPTSNLRRRALIGLLGAIALAALSLTPAAFAQTPQASVRPKVVLQMSESDPAKWNLALNNARNIQSDLGAANVDIELVAYVPAGVVEIMQRQQQGWAYIRP